MSTRDGGPAFPRPIGAYSNNDHQYNDAQGGMTLRDYFAGQALAAMMASPHPDYNDAEDGARILAGDAYAVADAMLDARGATP